MTDRQHQEGSAPGALGHHGNETRIDGAVLVVMDAACDRNTVVAVLPAGCFPEDVAEL